MAACEDLITTLMNGHYGSEWRVTAKGLQLLEKATSS
jgi:hypothetical protein